jgi:dTDP-4-dehydrorhamnose 3,5-epimerase
MVEIIPYTTFQDSRGSFSEVYRADATRFPDGIKQISTSTSKRGTVRGFHAQPRMSKMMRVVRGFAYFYSVNIDKNSPQYLDSHDGFYSPDTPCWVYAPSWYARAFIALDDNTVIEYLHSAPHNPQTAVNIHWNDPTINVAWSHISQLITEEFIVSEKDQAAPFLKDFEWSWT